MTTRREFIGTGCRLTGTLLLGAGAIATLAPSRTWALNLAYFNDKAARTLLLLTRHIYPHDTLEDAAYALVVKDLDAIAAGDPATAARLDEGIAALSATAGGDWTTASAERQLEVVETIAANPFFELVRSTAAIALYNNELAFAHFGYEGSAFEQGGYLNRGFNDLDWLPDPSPNASPRR